MKKTKLSRQKPQSNVIPFPTKPKPFFNIHDYIMDGQENKRAFMLEDGSIEIRNAQGQTEWVLRRAA